MQIKEIAKILEAEIIYIPDDFDRDITRVAASDLMSDVLADTGEFKLLLTGLNTQQVVRTALIMDLPGVVIVRGKVPNEKTVQMAKENEIPLLATKKTLFTCSALLFNAGLKGVDEFLHTRE